MDESLPIMLKQLRLPAFIDLYERYQGDAAEHAWGYGHYLGKLCEQEIARRIQSRIEKWTREAKLPSGKTFATLEINSLPKSTQKKLIDLRDNTQWALQADNLLLIGPSGVGKSHIAAALALHLIEQGIRVKWLPATALVQQLQQAKKELELMTAMSRFDKYRVFVIDDIGYVKKSDSETQVLFEFIAHRYESGSLIVTSNQPFSQWDHPLAAPSSSEKSEYSHKESVTFPTVAIHKLSSARAPIFIELSVGQKRVRASHPSGSRHNRAAGNTAGLPLAALQPQKIVGAQRRPSASATAANAPGVAPLTYHRPMAHPRKRRCPTPYWLAVEAYPQY